MKLENSKGPATGLRAKWPDTSFIGILLLVTLICYANSLGNGFVYDDDQQILQNPYVKSWHFLPQIFGTTVWSFVGQAGTTNYYRPLMTFSFLVLWQLFGPIPFGFHLFSIVMHAAVVILVFYVGRRLFADWRIGFISALLFAVHPIHTETVDWIAALPDIQTTVFLLLALYLLAYPDQFNLQRNLAIAVCFCLALLCKEPAFMFAPLAILYVHGVSDDRLRSSLAQKLQRYVPLCLAGIAYLLLRISLFGKLAPVLQRPTLTWPEAVYSAFALIVDYTRMLIWPSGLSAFHVFHANTTFFHPLVLGGVVIALLSLFAAWKLHRQSPSASFSILLIGFTLAPVLNARWMAANVFTERYLYLPSVGFCWLVAWLGIRVFDQLALPQTPKKKLFRLTGVLVFALVILLGSISTISRNHDWQTDLTLYTRTLQTNPDAHIIRSNLGGVYYDGGNLARAGQEWELALAGKPDSVNTMNALGILYTQQGRYRDAEKMLERAIAAKPLWADPHYNMGNLLHKTGDDQRALLEFQKSIELGPLNPVARYFYAKQLELLNNDQEAVAQFKKSVELDPSPAALQGLAAIYIKMGQFTPAETTLRKILAESPHDGDSHLALAKILEATGRKEDARKEFQAVLETDAANRDAREALKRLQNN